MNERELLKRLVELKDQKDRIDRAMRSDDFRERDYAGVEYHERYKPAKDAAWAEARALLEQPERALQPQWSDQPPTKPGWYWWRVSQKLHSPILMNVQQDMYSQFRIGGGAGTTVNSQGGQWAGPLTPPEE